jgi:hypothetical protein
MMTDADKLTLRGEIWLGFGDVSEIGSPKIRVRRSRMHNIANHGGCVSGREGPETNEGDRNLNFEIEMKRLM